MLVGFEIRDGRVRSWCSARKPAAEAAPLLAQTPPQRREFAAQSARLAARLGSADGGGAAPGILSP